LISSSKRSKSKFLIDPLDATHSFINKQYNEATILVGVLVKDKPYIGSITSPFYNLKDSKNKTGIVTYFNIPNYGIFAFKKQKNYFFDNVDNYRIEQVKLTKKSVIEKELYTPFDPKANELKLIVSRWKIDQLKKMLKPLLCEHVIKDLQMKVDNGMGYRSLKMIEEGYYFFDSQVKYGLLGHMCN